MSKESKVNHPSEQLEDASDNIENYDLTTSIRGKYHEQYQALKGKIPVTIKTNEGDKQVYLYTLKAQATIDENGHLRTKIVSDLKPGTYEVTITIEQPDQTV